MESFLENNQNTLKFVILGERGHEGAISTNQMFLKLHINYSIEIYGKNTFNVQTLSLINVNQQSNDFFNYTNCLANN